MSERLKASPVEILEAFDQLTGGGKQALRKVLEAHPLWDRTRKPLLDEILPTEQGKREILSFLNYAGATDYAKSITVDAWLTDTGERLLQLVTR